MRWAPEGRLNTLNQRAERRDRQQLASEQAPTSWFQRERFGCLMASCCVLREQASELSQARAGVEKLRNLGTDWNLAYGFSYECKGRNDVNSTYNIVPLRLVSTLCLGSGPWGGLKRPTKGPPALPGHFGRLLEVNYFTRPDPASRKRAGITPRDIVQRFKLGGRTPRYERISGVS